MGNSLSCVAKQKEVEETILPKDSSKNYIEKSPPQNEQSNNAMDNNVHEAPATSKTSDKKDTPPPPARPCSPMPADFSPKIVECITGKDPPKHGTCPYESKNPSPVDSTDLAVVEKLFKDIDDHAFAVSQAEQPDFLTLVWELIYSKPLTKPVEKARAIFFWVCSKDFQRIMFDSVEPNTPESTLFGIKEGRSNYAHVFQTLCSYSGLVSKVIRGYAKAHEYRPGMKIGGLQAQHVWNAVLIDGTWRLIDCYSAAHRIIAKQITRELVDKELDNFYFFTDANHLKYTHYPMEEKWQLLEHSVDLLTFENLAPVRSAFFKFGLELFSHPQGVINSQEELILKIKYPDHFIDTISFTFTLNLEGLGEIYKGSNMQRNGMHETTVNPNYCIFTFRFPRSGVYRLMLYCRRVGEQIFSAFCEYRAEVEIPVDKDGVPVKKFPGFPPTQQASYGITEHGKKYGLTSSHSKTAIIRADNGSVDIRFFMANKDRRMPELMTRLKNISYTDDALSQCLLRRSVLGENNQETVIVTAYLPRPGEYAMEVYASDSEEEDASLFLAWQFLIVTDVECPLQGLPTLTGNPLGPLEHFANLGLSTVSHKDPLIRVPTATTSGSEDLGSGWHCVGGDLGVELSFPETQAQRERLRLLAQFVYATNDADEDYSEYVLQQVKGNHVSLVLRFPKPGYYKLHIHALPYSDPGDTIPEVFTYLIDAPPRLSSKDTPYLGSIKGPFPHQNALWKEGCFLLEPFDGVLKSEDGESVKFCVQMPKQKTLGILCNDQWTPLVQEDNNYSVDFKLPSEKGTKLAICAKFGQKEGNFNLLLEYTVG